MTIPTYSPISDEEIAAGAAGKESVFRRLRDNVGAVLGFDPLSSSPSALLVNQKINSLFTYSGDGALGDVVISADDTIYAKASNYNNLTIHSGVKINYTSKPTGNETSFGPRGLMIIRCKGRFTLGGLIERYSAKARSGSFNGNTTHQTGDVDPRWDTDYILQTAKGLDGGYDGGNPSGGGSLLVVCDELDIQSTAAIDCRGNNNYSQDAYGGIVVLAYKTLISNSGNIDIRGGRGNEYHSHANGAVITLDLGAL